VGLPNPRLMPGKTKVLVEKFSWKSRVEGVLVSIPFSHLDYLELIVNGRVVPEGEFYERVIEDDQRGLLFKSLSTVKGWAILKVFR
jgi:hypothetical protein